MGWEGRGLGGAMGHRCMRVRAEMGVGEGGSKMLKRMSGEGGVDVGWKMLTQDLVERRNRTGKMKVVVVVVVVVADDVVAPSTHAQVATHSTQAPRSLGVEVLVFYAGSSQNEATAQSAQAAMTSRAVATDHVRRSPEVATRWRAVARRKWRAAEVQRRWVVSACPASSVQAFPLT